MVPSAHPASTLSLFPADVASETTGLSCTSGGPSGRPVSTSHARTVPSAPPESASRSPRANVTAKTAPIVPIELSHSQVAVVAKVPEPDCLVVGPRESEPAVGRKCHRLDRPCVLDPSRLGAGRDVPEPHRPILASRQARPTRFVDTATLLTRPACPLSIRTRPTGSAGGAGRAGWVWRAVPVRRQSQMEHDRL